MGLLLNEICKYFLLQWTPHYSLGFIKSSIDTKLLIEELRSGLIMTTKNYSANGGCGGFLKYYAKSFFADYS